jgi:uncharacterized protein YdiU (UPF0061 family)
LDRYDPQFICNGSDHSGRYSFGNQPEICQWNCEKLAEAISPFLPLEMTMPVVKEFKKLFNDHFLSKMRKKLGLFTQKETDMELVQKLLKTMETNGADMTNTFRSLSRLDLNKKEESLEELLDFILKQGPTLEELAEKNKPELSSQELEKLAEMGQKNPFLLAVITGRSLQWVAKQFQIKKVYESLISMNPVEKRNNDKAAWINFFQLYLARLEEDIHGLSPEEKMKVQQDRITLMNNNNPKIILRNYIAQNAIELAEKGDFSEVKRLLKVLSNPFSENHEFTLNQYDAKPPQSASKICVTCSS